MRDLHTSDDHAEHAQPAHSTVKKILTIGVLALVPLALVIALIGQYTAHDGRGFPAAMTEEAVAERIQKVGQISLGAAIHAIRTGEEVFKAQCTNCHTAGLLNSPKLGDTAAWAPRIATGYAALLNSALKGKNAMTPQGGGAFSDYEVSRAVVYMANAGGAKFEEPAAPEDATVAAPEASASAPK